MYIHHKFSLLAGALFLGALGCSGAPDHVIEGEPPARADSKEPLDSSVPVVTGKIRVNGLPVEEFRYWGYEGEQRLHEPTVRLVREGLEFQNNHSGGYSNSTYRVLVPASGDEHTYQVYIKFKSSTVPKQWHYVDSVRVHAGATRVEYDVNVRMSWVERTFDLNNKRLEGTGEVHYTSRRDKFVFPFVAVNPFRAFLPDGQYDVDVLHNDVGFLHRFKSGDIVN
jgi:hypothetical protein